MAMFGSQNRLSIIYSGNHFKGFGWGTVKMKSAKQRNDLIELAKTKPFIVGFDHFQVSFVSEPSKVPKCLTETLQ